MKIKLILNSKKEYVYYMDNGHKQKINKTRNHKGWLVGKMTEDLYNAGHRNLVFDEKTNYWSYDNPDGPIRVLVEKYLNLTSEESLEKYNDMQGFNKQIKNN